MGVTVQLVIAIIASACWSGFQHGYNTAVINAPANQTKSWMKEVYLRETNRTDLPDEEMDNKVNLVFSVIVSLYAIGGMVGGIISGHIADRFGRKGGLLLNNVFVFIGSILESTSKAAGSIEMLIIGRLLIGVNSGLNACLAPLYISEISPVNIRGSLGTVYQLIITISILLANVLGLNTLLGTVDLWPWLFAVCVIPAALQCAMLTFCPESPKYLLLNRGHELQAQRGLTWLRGSIEVHSEMEEMRQEAERNKISKKVTLKELFSNGALRYPLIISIVIMIAQQLSGINAVMFYSTTIFAGAGLTEDTSKYATMGVGVMNVLMTFVSLILVEKAGRKTLLLVGFIGMFITSILLFGAYEYTTDTRGYEWISYSAIALVILFVVMFATGPGSIPWFIVTELFNQSSRPAATAVAVTTNWAANFLVGIGFLASMSAIGGYVFLIFAALQMIFIVFIYLKVPETKNKTTEEITSMFKQTL